MKKQKLLALLILTLVIFSACGANSNPSYDTPREYAPNVSEKSAESGITMDTDIAPNSDSSRKVIVTYSLEFDTKEYLNSIKKISELLKANNGYTMTLNESVYGSRYVTMQLKVPKEKVEDFVNQISDVEILNLINRNMESSDVTSQYTDNELRLKTQKEKLTRLYELQKDQKDLETLLQLENEISDTIYKIESIEMELKNLDSKIDYSTINISIREVSTNTTTYTKLSFFDRVKEAIGDSFSDFLWVLEDIVIALIFLFPFLVLLVLIFLLVRFLYRKFKKKEFKFGIKKSTKISDKTERNDDSENKNL